MASVPGLVVAMMRWAEGLAGCQGKAWRLASITFVGKRRSARWCKEWPGPKRWRMEQSLAVRPDGAGKGEVARLGPWGRQWEHERTLGPSVRRVVQVDPLVATFRGVGKTR